MFFSFLFALFCMTFSRSIHVSAKQQFCSFLIKATMSYHPIPIRIAITIKNSMNSTYWRGCREKGTLLYCWWECGLAQPLWRTIQKFLKKLKIKLSSSPMSGHIPRQNHNSKKYMHPNVYSSTVFNSQYMETTCVCW